MFSERIKEEGKRGQESSGETRLCFSSTITELRPWSAALLSGRVGIRGLQLPAGSSMPRTASSSFERCLYVLCGWERERERERAYARACTHTTNKHTHGCLPIFMRTPHWYERRWSTGPSLERLSIFVKTTQGQTEPVLTSWYALFSACCSAP